MQGKIYRNGTLFAETFLNWRYKRLSKGKKTIEEQIKEAEQYFIDGKLSKALNILEPLSGQGQDRVEYLLSLIYEYGGEGSEESKQKSLNCISNLNLTNCLLLRFFNMSYMKQSDINDKDTFDKYNQTIIKNLAEFEKSTDSFIQFEIGLYYGKMFTGVQDFNKQIKYLEISAKQGMAFAANMAGNFYFDGYGVEKNYEIAKHYYEIGAKQNRSDCMLNLARCYYLLYDVKSAISWKQLSNVYYPNAADQLMPLFTQNTKVAQFQPESVTSTEAAEINTSEEDKKNEGLALFMLIATAVLYFATSLGFFKSIFYAFIATCILLFIGKGN